MWRRAPKGNGQASGEAKAEQPLCGATSCPFPIPSTSV